MFDLEGKVVVISGGAGGIGEHVVRAFLEEKVKHVAILDIAEKQGLLLQNELLTKHGAGRVKFLKCDVTDDDQLKRAYDVIIEGHGYIDVVVNNAGNAVENMAGYKKEIELNVTALVTSTMKAIELMHKGKGGRGGVVINVASVGALTQLSSLPVYCGTKSAVLQFSTSIGAPVNYARTGVKVITMCFGITETPILKNSVAFNEELHADFLKVKEKLTPPRPQSAAQALIHACKVGESASVWVSRDDQPAVDITETYKQAHAHYKSYLSFDCAVE